MKKNFWIIALLVLAAGCREHETEQPSPALDTPVRFVAGATAESRTVVEKDDEKIAVTWKADDLVAIFGRGAVTGDNYPYAATPDRKNPATCSFAPALQDKIFGWQPGRQEFYAVYPYDAAGEGGPEACPVSLPTQQVQSAAGSPDHLAALGVMKAEPVSLEFDEANPATVNFTFHNLFSIVELRLQAETESKIDIPIKRIRLVSSDSDLTFTSGSVDLTAPVESGYAQLPVTVADGSREAVLSFTEQPVVKRGAYSSFFLMVAAGTHAEGALKLEVTAVDNSVCTVALPAVTFGSNRHFRHDQTLRLADFVAADPFEVSASATECRAGEEIVFTFGGEAQTIDFYSGEMFHEWEYAKKDRLSYSDIFFSFRSQLQGGAQLHPVTVKVSTDFDGTYDEEHILSATWTDITARFTLPSNIWKANNGPTTEARYLEEGRMIASGEVNLSSYYGDSETLHVAFFYHADKYEAALGNKRTGVWFTDIQAVRQEGADRTDILDQNKEEIHIVNGASYTDSALSGWGNTFTHEGVTIYPWRFWCMNNPTADRDAYAVMNPLERKVENFGFDKPESVKTADAAMPERYGYVFAEPGTYVATFCGTSQTLTDEKEVVRQFTITVKP